MTLPMLTQFMATPPATHSRLAPVIDRAAGQVDDDLLGALLERRYQVRVDLGDFLGGVAGRAGSGDERGRDARPARPEHPQREQRRVEREPGPGQRDRLGEQLTEPGRVAERSQRHHGAFLIAAPPAQVRGHRAVGVAERGRVADRLGDPVPDLVPGTGRGGDGRRAGLAETIHDQHSRVAEPGRGIGVQAVRLVVESAAHAGVRKGFPQLLHAPEEPPVDDGEARSAREGAGAGQRAEQVPGTPCDAAEVAVAVEVVGHYVHVGGADPGVVQQPAHGRGRVVASVLDARETFFLRHAGQGTPADECGGGVMGEGAQAEYGRHAGATVHCRASLAARPASR